MTHPAPHYRHDPRRPAGPYEHVVSVSGGKDSTALYLLALERGMPFTAVFSDTGHEHSWTYQAVADLPRLTGGPEIKIVRRDFTADMERKRRFIREKWPVHGVPAERVERALAAMQPTGNPFLDLCLMKGRFPSTKSKFCTDELKIIPMYQEIHGPILRAGRTLISWQGVRGEESLARRHLPRWQRINPVPFYMPKAERDFGETCRAYAYRPIHAWKLDDVWAIHAQHGVPRNRLYDAGASRVGCLPCINAGKDEIRMIADRFPEAVERVAEMERLVSETSKLGISTFFSVVDDPMWKEGDPITVEGNGIRKRVEWSKTSRGGKQYDLLAAADFGTSCNEWGTCE